MLKCMKWEMRRIFYQLRWILLTAAVTGGICWVRYYDPAGALKGQFDSLFWILNVTVSCCAICLRLYPWYNMLQSFTGDAYIMEKSRNISFARLLCAKLPGYLCVLMLCYGLQMTRGMMLLGQNPEMVLEGSAASIIWMDALSFFAEPVLLLWVFLELFRKLRRGNKFLALVLFLSADRVLIRMPFQNYTGIIELAIAAVFFWRIAWLADHCYEPA